MTGPAPRAARAELDSARVLVAGLDETRGTEDLAADLIETWKAIEGALRSLVGSTVLEGQPLLREARKRELISFDQANALAEFLAVYERVHDTNYRPTAADLGTARKAFLTFDASLTSAADAAPPRRPSAATSEVKSGPIQMAAEPIKVVEPRRRIPVWAFVATGAVVVAVALVLIFRPFGGKSGPLEQGITAYRNGQREAAVSFFSRATREKETAVLAHVYLARMAREIGNFTLASQELQMALEQDPKNPTALREMGANLLSQGNYELARRFYVRAIEADPTDKTSQGYLGCALMRLNRVTEATTFMNRAGPGPWTNCTPSSPPSQVP